MNAGDIEGAVRAAKGVGWGDQSRQISFLVKHPDCLGFVVEDGGKVIGASFGAANGRVGWIGLVLVSRKFRGCGLGSRLTRAVMEALEERGCRSLVLVATDMGKPLYEKLGFEFDTGYHGFSGLGCDSGDTGDFRVASFDDMEDVLRFDRRMTGEDRRRLLGAMPGGWMLRGDDGEARAHHFAAPWGGGSAIASDFEAGKAVVDLRRSLAGSEGSVRVWLTNENKRGREHMKSIGFEEFRASPRMVRGESVEWERECLWGIFSLAKG